MIDGIRPIVSQVAEFLSEKVLAVSLAEGVRNLKKDLEKFVLENEINLVVGVDAGGDSLAKGFERGLVSPLADSMMLSALSGFDSILAVVGFGSDGELDRKTLEDYLSELHSSILGVSIVEADDRLTEFIEAVESEASKIPLLARKGYCGSYNFWGETDIRISILNSLIFYLRLKDVYERSRIAGMLGDTESIYQANEILNSYGIRTELDFEIELAKRDGLL